MPLLRRRKAISNHGALYVPAPGGGATTTWNPSDKGADHTLSNGNLTITHGTGGFNSTRAIASTSSGKKFWEVTIQSAFISVAILGFGNSSHALTNYVGQNNNSFGLDSDGQVYRNGSAVTTIQTYSNGNVVGIAVDFDAELAWFRTNAGNWNNNGSADPATGTGGIDFSALAAGAYYPINSSFESGNVTTTNFGATAYAHTAPSGFGNW